MDMRNPTPDEVKFYFGVLDVLVRQHNEKYGFATSTGKVRRDVDPNEFMLMSLAVGTERVEVQFKHRDTRNYVYARRDLIGWRLDVPRTPNAFNRGEFDKFA